MSKLANNSKFIITTVAGFAVSVATAPFLPELVSLAIPTLSAITAYSVFKKGVTANAPAGNANTASQSSSLQGQVVSSEAMLSGMPTPLSTYSEQVLAYMKDIEQRVVEENSKNNLDDEIKQKVVSIVGSLEVIIPFIEEFNLTDLKHKVKRLVTVDLNGVINPFLKLPGNLKIQNRRKVLNGINEINAKMEFIQTNIHEKDLMELDKGLALISQRYNNNNIDKNI